MTDSAAKSGYDRTSQILVVDDDNTLLKFFKIHLNKFFSKVLVVKGAKDAMDEVTKGGIDLVLTDIRMPRVDGLQLLRKVKNHDASIPVLLISGAPLTDEQTATAEGNLDGFLRKPFDVDELHDAIVRGIERRDTMKRLAACVGDNKNLMAVIAGTRELDKSVPTERLLEARDLLAKLKAS